VSYKVQTKTTLQQYSKKENEVIRRFRDFAWLHSKLQDQNRGGSHIFTHHTTFNSCGSQSRSVVLGTSTFQCIPGTYVPPDAVCFAARFQDGGRTI